MFDERTPLSEEVYEEPYRVMYWKYSNEGYSASNAAEGGKVAVIQRKGPYNLEAEFKWPEERAKAEKHCHMLRWAWDGGRNYRSHEINQALQKLGICL